MDRPRRCLYVPTESEHCTNCGGLPERGECPMTGEPLAYGATSTALLNLGKAARALAVALGLGVALRFLADAIESTVNDDRA